MAITSAFGTFFDLKTGRSRQWFMGGDGVKRWVDTGSPVDESHGPDKCGRRFEPLNEREGKE